MCRVTAPLLRKPHLNVCRGSREGGYENRRRYEILHGGEGEEGGKNLIVSLNVEVAYFLLLNARAVTAAPAVAPTAAPIQAARVQVSSLDA